MSSLIIHAELFPHCENPHVLVDGGVEGKVANLEIYVKKSNV